MSSFLGSGGGSGSSPASSGSYGTIKLAGDLSTPADAPRVIDLSITGEQQGSVLYFNGTNWVQLPPATSGALITNGTGQNPSWEVILNTGTALLDFGAAPGTNLVSTVVTGQTLIESTSIAKAFLNKSSTADHNEAEHEVIGMDLVLTCGDIVPGSSFTIYAYTELRLTGSFRINWEWR